jgi:hypothetical protein
MGILVGSNKTGISAVANLPTGFKPFDTFWAVSQEKMPTVKNIILVACELNGFGMVVQPILKAHLRIEKPGVCIHPEDGLISV